MDCNRAWNLMMKSLDEDMTPDDEQRLTNHLADCGPCKTQYSVLSEALMTLRETRDETPCGIEAKIFERIRSVKHKGADLHRFVIPPAAVFFILAVLPLKLLKLGPIALMDKVFQILGFVRGTAKTVLVLLGRIMDALYIKEAILSILFAGMVLGIYCLVRCFVKYNTGLGWRLLK